MKSKVFVKFPRTGLGNMMLIWARGIVLSKTYNIPLVCSLWYGLRLGPILRNEPKKRFYWGYFKETPILTLLQTNFNSWFAKKEYNIQPDKTISPNRKVGYYIYNRVIIESDLFAMIRNHQPLIKSELNSLLSPGMKHELKKFNKPVISVHIRRGDFNFGPSITPIDYFIKAVKLIRENVGELWPVTIFTDARKNEIEEILNLPEVYLAEEKADILDIILMSQSKVIVLSKSSTFSYWAAFLSDAIVVRSSTDWQNRIRTPNENENYIEVEWDDDNSASDISLINALKKNHSPAFQKS